MVGTLCHKGEAGLVQLRDASLESQMKESYLCVLVRGAIVDVALSGFKDPAALHRCLRRSPGGSKGAKGHWRHHRSQKLVLFSMVLLGRKGWEITRSAWHTVDSQEVRVK